MDVIQGRTHPDLLMEWRTTVITLYVIKLITVITFRMVSMSPLVDVPIKI